MSFYFVNTTLEQRRHSADTMRTIRSRVMQNSRQHVFEHRRTLAPTSVSTSNSRSRQSSSQVSPTDSHGSRSSRDSDRISAPLRLSSTELLSILDLWERYRTWISSCPTAQDDQDSILGAQSLWHTPSSDIQLYALGLEAAGHLEAVQGRNIFLDGEQKTRIKTGFLGLAQEHLRKENAARDDAILAVLGYVTSFEVRKSLDNASAKLISMLRFLVGRLRPTSI